MWFVEPQIQRERESLWKWVRVSIPLSYSGKGQSIPSWTQLSLHKVQRVRGKKEEQVKTDLYANSDTNQWGQRMCCQFAYFQKRRRRPSTPMLIEPYVENIIWNKIWTSWKVLWKGWCSIQDRDFSLYQAQQSQRQSLSCAPCRAVHVSFRPITAPLHLY